MRLHEHFLELSSFWIDEAVLMLVSTRITLKIIPQEIIDDYNLTALVDDQGWVCMRIKKGMYSLKQAGIIADE